MLSRMKYDRKGSIYYIGSYDKFPRELEHCIEREIDDGSFIRIAQRTDLYRSEKRAEFTKRLFLIDDDFGAARKEDISCLRDGFPGANICMLINDELEFPNIIRDYFQKGLIKSVLPMNLRVDLWLGAIRLMLNGGNYLPGDAIKYMSSREIRRTEMPLRTADKKGAPRFNKLTKRETEVLRLISEGHQNKNIAEKLSLSEHTIKLHIHHIISKLGVSNRTEAAAVFLQEN